MPESANQPTKPIRTWRPMVLWTVGLLLLVGLIIFASTVIVPLGLTMRTIRIHANEEGPGAAEGGVKALGGPERAVVSIRRYLALPERLAPHRRYAVSLLSACGAPAVPTLLRALADRDRAVRCAAADALGRIGEGAAPAAAALLAALDDPDDDVREAALGAIWCIGPGIAAAVSVPASETLSSVGIGQDNAATRKRRLMSTLRAVGELKPGGSPLGRRAGAGYQKSGRSGVPTLLLSGERLHLEVDEARCAVVGYYDKERIDCHLANAPKTKTTPSQELVARMARKLDVFAAFGWSEYRDQFPEFVPATYTPSSVECAEFRAARVWQGHRYYRDSVVVRFAWDSGELNQFYANFTPEPPASTKVVITAEEAAGVARKALIGHSRVPRIFKWFNFQGELVPSKVAVEPELVFVQPNDLLSDANAEFVTTGPARLAYTAVASYSGQGALAIQVWVDAADGRPLGLGDYGPVRARRAAGE